jgi:hypothetical protein
LLTNTPLASLPDTASLAALQTETQGLLDYAETITTIGNELMFTIDIPYVPIQEASIVLAQTSVPGAGGLAPAGSTQTSNYILTACSEIPSIGDPTSAERFIDPIGRIAIYYYQHFKLEPDPSAASSTLLEGPKHGKIVSVIDNVEWPMYRYDAEPGYEGKDQLVFQAQYHGKTYKVVMNLQVAAVGAIPDNGPSSCPAPTLIKLRTKPASGISGYNLNAISVSFSALASIYGVRFNISLGSGRFQSKMERMTERRAVPLPKGRPKRQGAA